MNRDGRTQKQHRDAPAPAGVKSRVRDRIFQTACNLFYRHGIRAVGVDAIASEAGTNKMSFYRSFPSKDELVAEYLGEQERELWAWWDETVAHHPDDPRRQIEALFAAQLQMVRDKTCRGCALGNAAAEMSEDDNAVNTRVREYKKEVRRRLRRMAHASGAREPDQLGDALMLLMDGSFFTRLVFPGTSGPIAGLLHAVSALLDAHLGPAPKRGQNAA